MLSHWRSSLDDPFTSYRYRANYGQETCGHGIIACNLSIAVIAQVGSSTRMSSGAVELNSSRLLLAVCELSLGLLET